MNLSYTKYIGENKMNLSFTLSLEQRTLANIAIILWNQDDVRDLMSKPALQILHNNWLGIKKAVIEKSFKLKLPKRLQENLLNFIVRVGFQILSWVDLHHCRYNIVTELPATFVWTSLGTINNVRTAKLLVMGGTLDDDSSFTLACMYCLENEIRYHWNMFEFSFMISKFRFLSFIFYWVKYMYQFCKKELLLPYQPAFMIPRATFVLDAVKSGNAAATKYFFNANINSYEFLKNLFEVVALRLNKLENIISLQRHSDVMLFLLSKMNIEQQTNMIVKYTLAFLKCFLVWPRHSVFLEIAKDMWNFLSKKKYSDLLHSMVYFMHYEPNLHKLFEKFWQQSPEAYKQFFTDDQGNIVDILISLYKTGDENNVKLILKDSSISTKKNILKIESKPIFVYLVSFKMWDSIEFLIQECLSSREDLIRFRDVFKTKICMGGYSNFEFNEEYQWNKFFQLVDYCISRYNKRKKSRVEDNTSSKKYLCDGIEK